MWLYNLSSKSKAPVMNNRGFFVGKLLNKILSVVFSF